MIVGDAAALQLMSLYTANRSFADQSPSSRSIPLCMVQCGGAPDASLRELVRLPVDTWVHGKGLSALRGR